MVKFDFLGLTTLTILDWTLRYVQAAGSDVDSLRWRRCRWTTRPPTTIFKGGNTTAVFQFESRGMRELLLQAPPKRFDDIVALVALYRPGPMELIPDYVRRKQGTERLEYHDARLEPILAPTYGVMVYQEQVMQIAQVIGGYTLGAADLLRRAMGKKLPDEMAKHRQGFICGAIDRGLPRQGDAAFRSDGEIRRIRIQQVARGRVRFDRLSDGLFQGPLPCCVHGGELVVDDGRHRQAPPILRRGSSSRTRGAAARHQRVELPL